MKKFFEVKIQVEVHEDRCPYAVADIVVFYSDGTSKEFLLETWNNTPEDVGKFRVWHDLHGHPTLAKEVVRQLAELGWSSRTD